MKLKSLLIALAVVPSFAFAELEFSTSDLGSDAATVAKQLEKLNARKKQKRIKYVEADSTASISMFSASESFWSTTIYPWSE